MSKKIVTITKGGTELVKLYSGYGSWEEANSTIVNLTGWDDIENIEIETVAKLFGSGSYIVSKRIIENNVTLEAAIYMDNARSVRQSIEDVAYSLEPVTLGVQNADSLLIVEAYITKLNWIEHNDEEAEFTINFIVIDPEKR